MSHKILSRKPFFCLLTALLTSAALPQLGHAADKVIDLTPGVIGSWHHASNKPVEGVPDPLKIHKENVAVSPADLQLLIKDIDTIKDAESIAFECETYLENGNFQVILDSSEDGPNQGKGYVAGISNDKVVSIGYRGGWIGPWEWMSNADVTRPAGWTKIKFVWSKDGHLELFINGTLYVEKDDTRLPLNINQIQIQTNGEGNKYLASATLKITVVFQK